MNYTHTYQTWLDDPAIDEATHQELLAIAGDEAEIRERFFKNLEFGTGGLRGIVGAGTNRMNRYTVRKATQGLANYILANGDPKKGVAIAHDCRHMSPEFCQEAALVLNGNGIPTYVFDALRPTPLLSFAVRHLGCVAGIVVTASHNPPEYNGYKVYWDDGGQVPYPRDFAIITEVEKVTDFAQIKTLTLEEAKEANLFRLAPPSVDDAFNTAVLAQRMHPDLEERASLRIAYSPLYGAGLVPVQRALADAGYTNLFVVEEQARPDGNFPTTKSPNPEDFKAFALALELAKEKDADIILCTDPDADRVGVAVKNERGEYVPLTGNMTGVLLTEYLLSQHVAKGTLPPNAAIISTIVSTGMTEAVAKHYGAAYFEVLTGFKYFGDIIKRFENEGSHAYLFGFEESYGYLAGTHCRDKDAVVSVLLLCEAAAFYRKQGLTLWTAMQALYAQYGHFQEATESLTFKGVEGLTNMRRIMAELRAAPFTEIAGVAVTERRDYQAEETFDVASGTTRHTGLPVSDVLYYVLADGSWLCIRPSGTEPKIKIYCGTQHGEERLNAMVAALKERARVKPLYPTPLIPQRADPFIYRHTDGKYYFTASVPAFDCIELRIADTITGLANATPCTVWTKNATGVASELIWAPEIHYLRGKWYIYFAAAHTRAGHPQHHTFQHRMYVLEADDPTGAWVEKGELQTGMESFCLDATAFEHNGKLLYCWAQKDPAIRGNSNIYIAEMINPWTLKTAPVMLTKPEYDWECSVIPVAEGPAVLKHKDKIFITYSANATGIEYCVGLLTANADSDLLDPQSWHKSPTPVFGSCVENGKYGPGHNSFTVAEDGETPLIVFHVRDYTEIVGSPLDNPDRHTCVQVFSFDASGNPVFGVPNKND